MKNKTKKILLLIFAFSMIGVFYRFNSNLSFPDSSINLEKGDEMKLETGKSLSQKFTANRNGLSKIQFLLRSPKVKPEDKIKMTLLDEDCKKEIRNGFLEYAYLDTGNLYEFKFDRIAESKDKAYCVIAKFEPANPKSKKPQFFTMKDGSGLSIRPAYNNTNLFQDLSELNERISQYKPWFLKHHYLWLVSLSFIILSLGLIVALINFKDE